MAVPSRLSGATTTINTSKANANAASSAAALGVGPPPRTPTMESTSFMGAAASPYTDSPSLRSSRSPRHRTTSSMTYPSKRGVSESPPSSARIKAASSPHFGPSSSSSRSSLLSYRIARALRQRSYPDLLFRLLFLACLILFSTSLLGLGYDPSQATLVMPLVNPRDSRGGEPRRAMGMSSRPMVEAAQQRAADARSPPAYAFQQAEQGRIVPVARVATPAEALDEKEDMQPRVIQRQKQPEYVFHEDAVKEDGRNDAVREFHHYDDTKKAEYRPRVAEAVPEAVYENPKLRQQAVAKDEEVPAQHVRDESNEPIPVPAAPPKPVIKPVNPLRAVRRPPAEGQRREHPAGEGSGPLAAAKKAGGANGWDAVREENFFEQHLAHAQQKKGKQLKVAAAQAKHNEHLEEEQTLAEEPKVEAVLDEDDVREGEREQVVMQDDGESSEREVRAREVVEEEEPQAMLQSETDEELAHDDAHEHAAIDLEDHDASPEGEDEHEERFEDLQ